MATVKDILAKKGTQVVTMVDGESVLNAARLMNERGIGGVVVTDDTGMMVGVFTERDILRRVVAEQRDAAATRLRDVMTWPVQTCRPETSLDECIALMTARRMRHIPVLRNDALDGIITSGDILAYQVNEQRDTIQYLNSYVFDLR